MNRAMPTTKGIYSFDLATRKMPAEPVFKIDLLEQSVWQR
jgi:hypothetical protein